jgi:hypothetical protein
MNEREQIIDKRIMEIIYDNVNSPFRWVRVCDYIQSRPDIEWGRDVLPAIRRLGLFGKYYYELKKEVNNSELEEAWEDFIKSNQERSKAEYSLSEYGRKYNDIIIRKEDDNEETWNQLGSCDRLSFYRLKSVDIARLLSYPQLESLTFNNIRELKNLHLLEQMPNLKKLHFEDIRTFTSEKEKISLNLEAFHCSNPKIANSIIHNAGMKFLWLDHMDTILDLQAIGSFDTLEKLYLDRITKVIHPEALSRAKNLKSLRLFVIRPGDDWSAVKELPLLHTFEFNAEPTLKESLCNIILSHPWVTIDPNFAELTITTLNYIDTFQSIDIYERVQDSKSEKNFCVFGDFSNRVKGKSNVKLEALVKEQIKQRKIKTKYLFDCEAGMFSVDAPTLEDAHQLIEILKEILDS